jgi:hypothetical protein
VTGWIDYKSPTLLNAAGNAMEILLARRRDRDGWMIDYRQRHSNEAKKLIVKVWAAWA